MTISKLMKGYPQLATRFVLMPNGVGRELKNLRDAIDAGFFRFEHGIMNMKIHGSSEADIKVAGRTGDVLSFLGGWPEGYEKASYTWVFGAGPTKTVAATAVKPTELGNLIHITWASGGAAAVSVDGLEVTLTIKNDGTTTPNALQALVAADPRLKGMIAITSPSGHGATGIPNTFVTGGAATTQYLANGAGLGWGFDIQNNQVWGNTAGIAFVATKPGLAGAKYEVAWSNTGTLGVTATRKRCTITYNDGVTTVAAAVAAVQANKIASEHLTPIATGDGLGVLTGLDTKVYKLGLDFGTMVQVGDIFATITAIARDSVTYDYGAQVGVVAATTANAYFRLGLLEKGVMSFPTIA
ncbi:MAG: hypothetical protein GYA36_19740 [Veillonellaceae bacterium]|nr:hypothetical protein [Veillonellaceae bacterium]